MFAGLVERSRNPRDQTHRSDLLNDAIIFLQALEQGQTVLTRNIRDFSAFLALARLVASRFTKANPIVTPQDMRPSTSS